MPDDPQTGPDAAPRDAPASAPADAAADAGAAGARPDGSGRGRPGAADAGPSLADAARALGAGDVARSALGDRALFSVPIEVIVSVGRAHPMIKDVIAMRRDSVLPLESRVDDPVEIYIGARLVARGELQELDDDSGRLGVRLTEVVSLADAG